MITQADLQRVLVEEFSGNRLRPDDVTVQRLCKATRLSQSTIRRRLAAKIEAGELEAVACKDDKGYTVIAYRLPIK